MKNNQLTSSRKVGVRDINAALVSTPVSRIKTLRDDEGRGGFTRLSPRPLRERVPVGQVRGFTLIELLITVLIIAVLAAIALPQYQKAVVRSRSAQIKQLLRVVADAERAYYMEHGKYAANFNELDIDIALTPVKTGIGKQTGACNTGVQGTDSARTSDDFYIALNSLNNAMPGLDVVGYWSKGRYKCSGFGIVLGSYLNDEKNYIDIRRNLHCREAKATSLYKAGEGNFCIGIENGFLADSKSQSISWRIYELP